MPMIPRRRPSRTVLSVLAMLTMVGMATAARADGAWIGSDWSSPFGPIFLAVNAANNEVEGEYPDFDGRLVGTVNLDATRIDATWLQATSDVRCDGSLGGTYYWGTVTWVFDPPQRMTGKWAYCNGPWEGEWHATLIGGTHPRKAMGY